jgi:SAM-dependent methyltransferase
VAERSGRPILSSERFDETFTAVAVSPGLRAVWRAVDPELPTQIEPYSFVSGALLVHLASCLELAPGQTLVDLACGRGGPGLWLAQQTGTVVVGVDFSPVAVSQAAGRAPLFGMAERARFVVGDLCGTGLAAASADAVVCIDALHFARDVTAAAREVARILRPGRRLVLTNWQPQAPGDPRLPDRLRDLDWEPMLRAAGFDQVRLTARPEWQDLSARVFQAALDRGDPGQDTGLAALQDEARQALPHVDLLRRVVITATRRDR